jgi:hypothetical protein
MEGQLLTVSEPLLLDRYVHATSGPDVELPNGWTRHSPCEEDPCFVYAKNDSHCFRHLVPVMDVPPPQSGVVAPLYLICATTTAFLQAVSCLRRVQVPPLRLYSRWHNTPMWYPKTSAFDKTMFEGPPETGPCPIFVLHAPNGAFAGLLRLPGDFLPNWTFHHQWKFVERYVSIGSNGASATPVRVKS